MRSALAIVAAVAGLYALSLAPSDSTGFLNFREDDQFVAFIAKHGKSYKTKEEYLRRGQLFKAAVQMIEHENAKPENTHRLAVNKFADWSREEYKSMLKLKVSDTELPDGKTKMLPTTNLPQSVDWRDRGAVSPVLDQNAIKCGSCWAFAAVAAMEGRNYIKRNQAWFLSQQQFLDCCHIGGSDGCHGGQSWAAFECSKSRAQRLASDYPYTAGTDGVYGNCTQQDQPGVVMVEEWYRVADEDPDQLKAAIALGPVAVAMESQSLAIEYYSHGIFSSSSLCGTDLDHAVTAVGYGVENGREFYIIRNSFGPDWGENGYIKLGIEKGKGVCGIQMWSFWPEMI